MQSPGRSATAPSETVVVVGQGQNLPADDTDEAPGSRAQMYILVALVKSPLARFPLWTVRKYC
jgi:hypothetical protein